MKRIAALILALALACAWGACALAESGDAPVVSWQTPDPTATPVPGMEEEDEEEEEEEEDVYYITVREDTDVRSGAGDGYTWLGTLYPGDVLLYLDAYGRDGDGTIWYKVQYGDQEVWVCSSYVDLEYGPLPPTASPDADAPQPTAAPQAPAATQVPLTEDSIGTYEGEFTVEVSSYRPASQNVGIVVSGDRAIDGSLTTAWNTFGESIGEWIRIGVQDDQKYQIGGFRIAPGYWKNREVFYANNRPKEIEVSCDDVSLGSFTLSDDRDYQTVTFAQPVAGSSIQITIKSLYSAEDNSYIYPVGGGKDCCVTEVELIGPSGGLLTEDAMDDWGSAVRRLRTRLMNLGGSRVERGDYGIEVVGLQLLLREGFGVLDGAVDGIFGGDTQGAVERLAGMMQRTVTDCEAMTPGVVDGAYWRNMMRYIDEMNGMDEMDEMDEAEETE